MILFVGPLPPPVHGFSTINGAMLEALQGRDAIQVFDRAPGTRGLFARLGREGACLARFAQALWQHPAAKLYLGLSGGAGQLLDALYLLMAGFGRHHRVVHHHSYAYLNRPTPLARACLACARGALHVVLCPDMAQRLSGAYGIPAHHIQVLSNVAFLEDSPSSPPSPTADHPAQRLGFLSYVTEEKGIFRFLEILRLVQAQGLPVEGHIVGPLDPSLRERFALELANTPGATYLGALYGEAKRAYLQGLDALVFPTRYRNEAEPVVILEALREGVPVLSTRRGCIEAQLAGQALPALPEEGFEVEAAAWLLRLGQEPGFHQEARQRARQGFQTLHGQHRATLEGLLRSFEAVPTSGQGPA